MTDNPAPVRTYEAAATHYTPYALSRARERFGELTTRAALARCQSGPRGEAMHPPLALAEHLEVLALGELLARHYRHPARVHDAVAAGATWAEIAAATGVGEDEARHAYAQWADGQHQLHEDSGRYGLADDEHAAAIARAAR